MPVKISITGRTPREALQALTDIDRATDAAVARASDAAIRRVWTGFVAPTGTSLRGWQVRETGDGVTVENSVDYAGEVKRRGASVPLVEDVWAEIDREIATQMAATTEAITKALE